MLGLQRDTEYDPDEVAEDAPDEEDPPGAKHTGKAKAKPKATPRPRDVAGRGLQPRNATCAKTASNVRLQPRPGQV